MTTLRTPLVATGIFVALSFACPPAWAHGDDDRERTVKERAATGGGEPGAEAEADARFTVGVDFVAGWGKTLAADQIPPGSANVNPVNTVSADPVSTDSFVVSFDYAPVKHVGVGLRIPLTTGTISPDGYQSRFISAFGNVELEGEYAMPLSKNLALVLSLGFALPTAQGTEVPATTAGLAGKTFDQE